MGARGKYETVSKVVAAFTKQRTWRQAELARALEIQSKQLGKILEDLTHGGMPLEREEELPQIYWSVPASWFPGGVYFSEEDLPSLVLALLSLSSTTRGKSLLHRLLRGRTSNSDERLLESTVGAIPMDDDEHEAALRAEEAISREHALEGRYYSTERTERVLSPYRVVLSPRPRLLALCHRDQTLKWFRLDSFERPRVSELPRVSVSEEKIEAFLATSVDGFNDGTDRELSFFVDAPDARWVKRNLPSGMRVDPSHPSSTSIRVLARGGKLVVARFVVGLGNAARIESPELREVVTRLAQEALENARRQHTAMQEDDG